MRGGTPITRDVSRHFRGNRAYDKQLRLIVESAREYAIITTDPEGRVTSWSRGAQQVVGWSEAEALGRDIAFIYTEEDRAAGRPERERACALTDGRAENQRWHVCKNGVRFWASGATMPLRGAEPGSLLIVVRERTADWRSREQNRLLLAELDHRVKNMLATVSAIATQSAIGAGSVEDYTALFHERLLALSRVHETLSATHWQGATLREIAAGVLAPYQDAARGRLILSGVDVPVDMKAAEMLGMAFHELATNALKYGALSVPQGRVQLTSAVAGSANGISAVQLAWVEEGGPAVAPPSREGFGTQLIRRGLPHVLGGSADLVFDTNGMRCVIEFETPDDVPALRRAAELG